MGSLCEPVGGHRVVGGRGTRERDGAVRLELEDVLYKVTLTNGGGVLEIEGASGDGCLGVKVPYY